MLTFLKIITLPIWLPIKIFWLFSKMIAVIIMIILILILVYLAIHFL